MKLPKINSPKLKNPTICFILFHLGLVLSAILLLFSKLVYNFFGMTFFLIYLIISIIILPSLNLMVNEVYFSETYILLSYIKAWKRDRLWYETNINGKDRSEAERILSARITKKGTSFSPIQGYIMPMCVQYLFQSHKNLFTAIISSTDKICLIYSIPHLDDKLYKQIMTSANKNISALVKETRKKYTLRLASSVIILADSIGENLPSFRIQTKESQNEVVLPCIVDFSTGRYYFDGRKIPQDISSKSSLSDSYMPIKNSAINLIIKTVFAGQLPLKNNNNFTQFDGISLETTFWDYMKKNFKDISFFAYILPYIIKEEQIIFSKKQLYFKTNRKVIAWKYIIDKDNNKKIKIFPDISYVIPKFKFISKDDRILIQKKITAYLQEEGWKTEFHKNEKTVE